MSRYGKYFLQHLLWLEDSFCHYYVQSDFWGRTEILDVEYLIFNYGEDAAYWMVQCAKWDPHTTIRRLRSFLSKDCLTQYQVHRMNDRQVVRTTARELCMNAYRMVIEPKIGWAVRLDPDTQEPVQPIAVEGAPEIDGMLDDLKVELDALVAGQKQNYTQWEARLAKMSDAEKAALYGKKAGGGLYNATIGSIVDLVKAAPGLAKKWVTVWWTFHTYPLRLADITAEAIRTGSTEPLQKELQTKLGPVVQSAQQLKQFTSMTMVLLGEPATRDMLLDFVERYWDNTHPLEKTEMGAEAVSDVAITILLAIFTAGVGAAANIAAKSGRLVKVAKMLEKLAGALKRIKSLRRLPKKQKKISKGRAARRAKSNTRGKGPHQPRTPDKKPDIDGNKKSGYSEKKDGPKTAKNDSVLNSGGDRLSESIGPARINNADEYNAIIKDLEDNGVDISYRENALAYGPSSTPGKPGSIVLDPHASISAVRHEYGHFLDDKALGFPPVREYYENPRLRIVSERRQYLREIETARKIGDNKARRALIQDYLEEKKYIIDNFYKTPYGR